MSTISTVGIIGLGSFGRFVYEIIPETIAKVGYDPEKSNSVHPDIYYVDFEELLENSNVLVLAIPLEAYSTVLPKISRRIREDQLIVDVCSVKVIPERLIKKYLPNHPNLLITHPLFGPQSFKKKVGNNKLIVTKTVGKLADDILLHCLDNLGIESIVMSAEEHDRAMADIHALTFFVAKSLEKMGLKTHELPTPSYSMITDLVDFSKSHSPELFATIENGNPFAKEIRSHMIKTMTDVDEMISEIKVNWE